MTDLKDLIDQLDAAHKVHATLVEPIVKKLKENGYMGEGGALTDKAKAELIEIHRKEFEELTK